MQVNAATVNDHKGDMDSTVAAIHSGSGNINVQSAGILWGEVQSVVMVGGAGNGSVGNIHFIAWVDLQEENVNTVAAIHGLVVLVVNTCGVAVDAVPYEVVIVACAGGIHEQVATVNGENEVDDAVAACGILINALECESSNVQGQRVETILLISVSLAGCVV